MGWDATRTCRQRKCGAVIAGGVGDHATHGQRVGQRPDCVAGAAKLERASPLQVLALEQQFGPDQGIDRARCQHRRRLRMRRDAAGGGLDVGKVNCIRFGVGGHRWLTLGEMANNTAQALIWCSASQATMRILWQ